MRERPLDVAGLRDPIVGHALSALHADPATAWTVEALAHVVAVSRSVLAERFTAIVGQPPMQYLALWRMQLASRLLIEGRHIADVSSSVGYESEAGVQPRVQKARGPSPGTCRRWNNGVVVQKIGRRRGLERRLADAAPSSRADHQDRQRRRGRGDPGTGPRHARHRAP